MSGTLYGIGVGPGDPELVTLQAVRLLKACPVWAIPISSSEGRVAWEIARQAVPEAEEKERLELDMPMTRDQAVLTASHQLAAERIAQALAQGRDVAFLTIGDPSIYSTYSYVQERVQALGFAVQMAPGVPSFCAVAAALGLSLGQGAEAIHILPALAEGWEAALEASGTKVIMKAGRRLPALKEELRERGLLAQAAMVQQCGLSGQRIWQSLADAEDEANYLSTIILKPERGPRL